MNPNIRKALLLGIGFGALTVDETNRIITRIRARGKRELGEGRKVAGMVLKRAKNVRREVTSILGREFREAEGQKRHRKEKTNL